MATEPRNNPPAGVIFPLMLGIITGIILAALGLGN